MAYAAVMSDSRLEDFIAAHRRLFVLTGAGCSTGSGIPDYRDEQGAWKRTPPVTYQAFVGDGITRRRYWARSLVGWPRIAQAQPNAAHRALAALAAGRAHLRPEPRRQRGRGAHRGGVQRHPPAL